MAPSRPGGTAMQRVERELIAMMAIAVGIVGLASGCGEAGGQTEPSRVTQPRSAEEIFKSSCVTCHGPGGRGGFGKKLDDGALRRNYASVDEVVTVITEGREAMPPWKKKLTGEEIARVAQYVYDL